jgi:hypothetical protein
LTGEIKAEFTLEFLDSFKNLFEHGLFYAGEVLGVYIVIT